MPNQIGTHWNCGGNINYFSQRTLGYRLCEKCGANSFKGQDTTTVAEAREMGLIPDHGDDEKRSANGS